MVKVTYSAFMLMKWYKCYQRNTNVALFFQARSAEICALSYGQFVWNLSDRLTLYLAICVRGSSHLLSAGLFLHMAFTAHTPEIGPKLL